MVSFQRSPRSSGRTIVFRIGEGETHAKRRSCSVSVGMVCSMSALMAPKANRPTHDTDHDVFACV